MKENERFGKLVVVRKTAKRVKKPSKAARWLCVCDCGNEKDANEDSLRNGNTTSCGCERGIDSYNYKNKIKNRIEKGCKIDQNGCWIWLGAKHKQGYGNIAYKNKPELCHRIAWIIFNGPIPEGIKVCHKCDVTGCCNPEHLFLGTQKNNVEDGIEKGRYANRKLGKRRNKLDWDQVQEIKKLSDAGMTRKELEEKFSVGQTCIYKILNGISWNINWTKEI
jgi:hypothetical protein